jgi:ATPase subunit of ABC transporter with duplicated ATPase domains
MIAGASAPDAGRVRLGASLYIGYFAQQAPDVLNSDLTVIGRNSCNRISPKKVSGGMKD